MATKTVAEKARVKPGTAIAVLNPAPGVLDSLGLPGDVRMVGPADADLIFLFVSSRVELESLMPAAVDALASHAAIWVFFRKGSRAAGLDMSRNDVWAIAEERGLRPLSVLGVDDTWSAFRLRRGA